MNYKTCTNCGELKEVTMFSPAKDAKYGVHSQCKDCRAALRRIGRDPNRPKFKNEVSELMILQKRKDDLLKQLKIIEYKIECQKKIDDLSKDLEKLNEN